MAPNRLANRCGMTLIELLVVIGIIATLMGIFLPAVQRVREAASQSACRNNLRQIGIALHAYHNVVGTLPPGYTFDETYQPPLGATLNTYPGWGWAAYLLPHLEQSSLAAQLRWDLGVEDPYNAAGRTQIVTTFVCPSDRCSGVFTILSQTNKTIGDVASNSYAGCYGFGGQIGEYPSWGNGLFYRNTHFRFTEIPDGLSTTLAVGERAGSFCQGPWIGCLTDGTIRTGPDASVYVSAIEEAPVMVLARTSSTALNHDYAEPYDFFSPHPALGLFLFADGSVRSLTASTSVEVWAAIGTRAGSEVLPPGEF